MRLNLESLVLDEIMERRQSTSSPFLQRLSSFSNQVTVFLRVLFFSFSLSYFCFHCSAVSSMFTQTVFLMVFALDEEKGESYLMLSHQMPSMSSANKNTK